MNPGTRLGSYEIVSILGEGGMGQVYRARDTKLHREVAIKVLLPAVANDPDRLARFGREAQVLASLNHPNIAQIYGVEEADGVSALVLELVEGDNLADRIARGKLPTSEVFAIARQIAEALEAAHDLGIVHRDLKPANIKVRPDGTVKVLDFGLAKAIEPSGSSGVDAMNSPTLSIHATQAGIILGTAAYMSPEQARGKKVDRRTDIWAFGCVLFEMLTGKRAFPGENSTDTIVAVLSGEPAWKLLPAALTPQGLTVLRRALEKDPKQRLDSAVALRLEIDDWIQHPRSPVKRVNARGSLVVAAAVVTAIASTAAAWSYFTDGRKPADTEQLVFAVEPPLGKSLSPIASYPAFAVSPDSQYLVFTVGDNTNSALALKKRDSIETTLIPGADGGSLPFWSPDSRHIAFFADGALKRVPLDGGSAEEVCRVSDVTTGALGGTWNEDGVILFSASEGVMRVSAAGGTPTTVLKHLGGATATMSYRHPAWLPGGKRFLVSVVQPERAGVFIGSVDGDKPTELLNDASRAQYVGGGHILFVRQGHLLAQAFEIGSLSLVGNAISVASGVAYQAGRAAFTVSDTGLLFYRRQQPVSRFVWMDRSGNTTGAVGEPGDRLNPRISLDSRWLAFEQHDAEGRGDLWSMDLQRGSLTRLTFDGAHAQRPVWSPDGTRVAYSDQHLGLVIQSSDGTTQHARWPGTGVRRRPSDWTRDAKHLIYEEEDPNTKLDTWIVEVPNGVPQPLLQTKFSESGVRLSPDGVWMAYVSDESGISEIYMRRFPSGTTKTQISNAGGVAPRWSPDGRELFYVARTGELRAVAIGRTEPVDVGLPSRLFQIDLRGANGQTDYEVATSNRFLVSLIVPAHSSLVGVYNWRRSLDPDK